MKKTTVAVLIFVALILAGSLVWVANIGASTAISIKNKGYVSVTGFAKEAITSDLAIFRAVLRAEDPVLKDSYTRLAKDRKKASEFLESYAFSSEEVEFSPVEVKEKFKVTERGHSTHEFVHFQLAQLFEIESENVKKIERLASEMGELLGEGVKLHAGDPDYVYTELEDLKIEMIGRATANAKERAETIAKKGKFKLGPIASVRVGVFQITPKNSTKVSGYGINDTSSIEKEIKSVVEIKYFVK
jgi:uncharacterized protein